MIRPFLLAAAAVLAVSGCAPKGITVPSIFSSLKPQSYTWYPNRAVSGPVLVFVSIPRQEAVVYRNGIRIGRASCSTGRPGHSTPTGVFQILEKDAEHHSKTYDNAPMPYMQRLTWDGVALHAGFNPGHPDSHGCVRLPKKFAEDLYGITRTGGTVIISNSSKLPTMTLSDGFGGGGSGAGAVVGLSKGASTSIVVSLTSRKASVYQNGRKAGDSPVQVSGALRRFRGESVFIYAGNGQWHTVEGGVSFADMKGDLRFPDAVRSKVRQVLRPGATMVVTSEPIAVRGGQSRGVMSGE